MDKIKAIVVGCGDRACIYAEQGVFNLKEMEIVAIVDPDKKKHQYMMEHFNVKKEMCFNNIDEVLNSGKIADCVINGTMDQYHYETSLPFLKQGYDMLLEKPIVNNEKELMEIYNAAKENGCKLMICHVLRYAPFYKAIKQLINDGELGEIVNMQTNERVGVFHSSVSFIRGKWNSKAQCGSSLLLAKCCHDIDLICWLNDMTTPCETFSFGGRNFITEDKAPENSGNKCLVDCPMEVRKNCIYDVQSMYLDNCMLPWYPWQCTGKDYREITEKEKIESLKTYNPHGNCAYKSGGDLVDHQVVTIKFKNGSIATHNLTLGCMKAGRGIFISGTKGEIEGNVEDGIFYLRKYDKKTSTFTEQQFNFNDKNGETGGHFGGDKGLVQDFCQIMKGKEPSLSCTTIEHSITGHILVYAADKSLETGRAVKL